MNRYLFWVCTVATLVALIILAASTDKAALAIPLFPLVLFLPISLNKRRRHLNMSVKNTLLAFLPYYGWRQLQHLYFAK